MNPLTRITPNHILELKGNEIFVFGSNDMGKHRGGAAATAYEKFKAQWGTSEGRTGDCYAIPTIFYNYSWVKIPKNGTEIKKIKESIEKFIKYASKNKSFVYLVTEIGCGIAGFSPDQIAPLFKKAKRISNIYLPEKFWNILNQ